MSDVASSAGKSTAVEPASFMPPATEAVEQALLEFSGRAATHWACAPGRVNLIGDHTDYSGGLALPMAVNLHTVAAAAPSGRNEIRVHSIAAGTAVIPLAVIGSRVGGWSDYLRGVVAGYQRQNVLVPGFDVVLGGDLPLGAGLSSSASLELCFAALIEELSGTSLNPKDRALLCQQAEHDYAGVPCGILDQFAVSFARAGSAMLLDCQSQEITRATPLHDLNIAIVESGVSHALNDGGYAERRRQVNQAETILAKSLRLATSEDLASLSNPTLRRRARHVITENQRVRDFAQALNAQRLNEAGALMFESHESLASDFEVSCPELDALVLAAREAGVLGARMTGGGFGGSMVALVPQNVRDSLAASLEKAFRPRTGNPPLIRWVTPVAGARAWSTA